jgi:SAM-dependent methyltransferase
MSRVRAPIVRIVDHGESTTVLGPRGALRFDGDSAQLLRAVLEIHARPVTREALIAELGERSGGEVPAAPIDELLALLVREGVLIDAVTTAPRLVTVGGRRVVLAISGAVAAVDAPMLVRGLHAVGCDVRIALTRTARRFVSAPALDALTHHQVWKSLWQRDQAQPVPHINLAEWAELVIVWPASATTIARIAAGDCSDLVSAIVTATRAPVIVAPSMNDAMLGAPAVQDNLDTLRAHGRWVVHGALGVEVAHRPEDRTPMFGPAAPPSAIVEIARHLLADVIPRPRLPEDAAAWERLYATTPLAQLPWTHDPIDAPLATALAAHAKPAARLLDLGTGTGAVAIAAAALGYRVTATEVSATALARARTAAGELPILFALDDVTATHLDHTYDVICDRGVLHCLPPAHRAGYAATVTARCALTGTLLVVAHQTAELATHPISEATLRALLPAFTLVSSTPTTLSNGEARLFELRRS